MLHYFLTDDVSSAFKHFNCFKVRNTKKCNFLVVWLSNMKIHIPSIFPFASRIRFSLSYTEIEMLVKYCDEPKWSYYHFQKCNYS